MVKEIKKVLEISEEDEKAYEESQKKQKKSKANFSLANETDEHESTFSKLIDSQTKFVEGQGEFVNGYLFFLASHFQPFFLDFTSVLEAKND